MTISDRVFQAVSPQREIQRLNDVELSSLLDELSDRTWWNELWETVCSWATGEAVTRFMRASDPQRKRTKRTKDES